MWPTAGVKVTRPDGCFGYTEDDGVVHKWYGKTDVLSPARQALRQKVYELVRDMESLAKDLTEYLEEEEAVALDRMEENERR